MAASTVIGAVVATRCQLDGAAPVSFDTLPAQCQFGNGGAQVTGDGQHVLYAASISDAAQKERPIATGIAIDATPPTVRCSSIRPVLKTGTVGALVKATVTDKTSGAESQTVAVPAATSTPGTKIAHLTGSDNAGNTTTVKCPYEVLGQINPSLVWAFKPQGASTQVAVARRRTRPTARDDHGSLPRSRMSLGLTHRPSRQQTNMSAQELPRQRKRKRDHRGPHGTTPGLEPSRRHGA